MPTYHFVALEKSGKEQKGIIEAENEKHARLLLRQKTLFPIALQPSMKQQTKTIESKLNLFNRKRTVSAKDLAMITRQFATLLSAGLPIEESLGAVAEQTSKNHIKSLVLSVRSQVVEGHALAQALHNHPEAFTNLFAATVAAGEKTGHLDKVLVRLAEYTEKQWHLKQKLQSALIYPSMIILVAFGIVGFLLEFVVPKMIAVFTRSHQVLPMMTQVLIIISDGLKAYGIFVFALIGVSIFTFKTMLRRKPSFQERVHRFIIKLPLFGYAAKTSNTARFARTLAILSGAGVSILEAMKISAQLISSIPIKKAVEEAVLRVREGATIHLALKQTKYFSPMTIHMIASGESSGQLEPMLERVAHTQEDEILRLIEVALALFEPAIILVMGVVVLFIVLAVLLPIFQMNQFTG